MTTSRKTHHRVGFIIPNQVHFRRSWSRPRLTCRRLAKTEHHKLEDDTRAYSSTHSGQQPEHTFYERNLNVGNCSPAQAQTHRADACKLRCPLTCGWGCFLGCSLCIRVARAKDGEQGRRRGPRLWLRRTPPAHT